MMKLDSDSLNCFDVPVFVMKIVEVGHPIFSAVNDRLAEGAKRTPEEIVGKTAMELFGEDLGHVAYMRHMEVINSGEKLTYDVVLPVSDRKHNFRTTLVPVKDASDKVIQLVGMSFDRTAEVEGAAMQARASTANAEIERFISLAAHDLRTPMQNIQSLADMLREDFEDHGDGKLELINILEGVAVKATALISDILAHAQASSAVREMETFDVSQLSKDILVTLDPLDEHKLNVAQKWISSDKAAVQIALRNLCDNAIKHSGKGAVELSVNVDTVGAEVLGFSVQDNGVGFSDPAVAFLDGGDLRMDSGFGLLGVRRMITSRGGEIGAENLPDQQGSVVRFTMQGHVVQAPTIQ